MGKLSFRFGPGGGGGRRRGGCSSLSGAGPAAIFVVNPDPDWVGEEERPRGRAGGNGVWRGVGARLCGVSPSPALPEVPGLRRVRAGLGAGALGRSPAGRGGGGPVFFFPGPPHPRRVLCRCLLFLFFSCHDRRGDSQPYQVPAEAGVEGLEGAEGGREGLLLERRPQKSIQAFRCNTSETSTAGSLKIRGLVPLVLSSKV